MSTCPSESASFIIHLSFRAPLTFAFEILLVHAEKLIYTMHSFGIMQQPTSSRNSANGTNERNSNLIHLSFLLSRERNLS